MNDDTPNLPAVARGDQKLSTFAFEGEPVRVMDRDGEPWFILADVCRVLEIGNAAQAATRDPGDRRETRPRN